MATPLRKGPSNKKVGKDHTTQTILLIIAILLAAAGIAYYALVYRPKQLALQTTNSPSQIVTPAPGTQPEPDVPVVNDPYLNVPEWGVRIKLPPELQGDVTYMMNDILTKNSGLDLPPDLSLLSKRFSLGDLKCAVIEGVYPRTLINIRRELVESNFKTIEPKPFKVTGKYKYFYEGPTGCEQEILAHGSEADNILLNSLKESVLTTFEEIP